MLLMKLTSDNSNNTLAIEVVVPLKYLSDFWRTLDLLLFNREIELDLSWSKGCVTSEISRTPEVTANPAANPPISLAPVTETTGATFQRNSTKLYVPVVICI